MATDLGGRGAAADVEEVGRLATVQFDDVHGGHGQAGAVDQTADVAVQRDEVEIVAGRLHFGLVLLAPVAVREHLRLAEVGVVVEAHLGVQAHHCHHVPIPQTKFSLKTYSLT